MRPLTVGTPVNRGIKAPISDRPATPPLPSTPALPASTQRDERQEIASGTSAAIGAVPGASEAEKAAAARALVLDGTVQALKEVAAKVELLATQQVDLRKTKAQLSSRLKQATQTLERLDPKTFDPATQATIAEVADQLAARGARFDLKGLAAKLRALLPGGAQAQAATKPAVAGAAETAELSNAEKAKILRAHLDRAVSAYRAGNYRAVNQLLTDQATAARLGMHLNIQHMFLSNDPATFSKEELDSLVTTARAMSMSWDGGKVDLVSAGFFRFSEGTPSSKELHELPVLAKQLYPIMLEEWMHQLQRFSGKPVSRLTEEYMKATGARWEALHEMDIQAAFREWRFPVDEIGTVHAYPERGAFERWYQGQGRAGR